MALITRSQVINRRVNDVFNTIIDGGTAKVSPSGHSILEAS